MTKTQTKLIELAKTLNDELRRSTLHTGSEVVYVENDDTQPRPPAPAWYEPTTGDIHIHVDLAKVDPEMAVRAGRSDGAVVRGLLVHEASHSKHSAWLAKLWNTGLDAEVMSTLTTFEELRVEAAAVNASPIAHREYLRAALPLAMGDMKEHPPTTRYDVAASWGLIYGRSLTSVVKHGELSWLDDAARTVLGDDDVDALGDIIQETLVTRRAERLIELAEEWLEITGRPEKIRMPGGCAHGKGAESKGGEKSKAESGGKSEKEEKEEKEEEGESGTGGTEDDESSEDAMPGMGEFNSAEPDDDPEPSKKIGEELSEEDATLIRDALAKTVDGVGAHWNSKWVELADPMKTAQEVFGARRGAMAGVAISPPTPAHLSHVMATAKALEEMVVPSINKVTVASAAPPGRLRTREAVRGSAERAQGRMMTARPWEGTKRRHTTTRPIVLGIATDTSGSMKWAERAVADFAYTWANAGRRVGARSAAVTFGDAAQAIVGPGEVLSEVKRRSADGGREAADRALAALDGVLKLSHPNGAAKLLVIVSDGCLVITDEMNRVEQRLADFKRAGTITVWITPMDHYVKPLARKGLVEMVMVSERSASFDSIQKAVLPRLGKLSHS